MEFKNLIEARRSVRKYIASEISEAEVEVIGGEALNAPSWKNTEVTRYYAAISAAAAVQLGLEFGGCARVAQAVSGDVVGTRSQRGRSARVQSAGNPGEDEGVSCRGVVGGVRCRMTIQR